MPDALASLHQMEARSQFRLYVFSLSRLNRFLFQSYLFVLYNFILSFFIICRCTCVSNAVDLISQVLRQDIRSAHQGRGGGGRGGSNCEASEVAYECRLDTFTVHFHTLVDCVNVFDIRHSAKVMNSKAAETPLNY